jgi:hypothetical protein
MANTNKTKAEMLQELESIKGLLLEEDDIPILQDAEFIAEESNHPAQSEIKQPASPYTTHESVLPGQGSLFEEAHQASHAHISHTQKPDQHTTAQSADQDHKKHGFASHLSNTTHSQAARPQVKATGENPFLPQHIRERLHGNNPPPLFEYEAAKKIVNATKAIAPKTGRPRQQLVDDVLKSLMPQVERELRHRLFAMSVDDLEKLLNEEDDD